MIEETCVCGHLKTTHGWATRCVHTEIGFTKDGHKGLWKCICTEFKLDNLQLIEDLAKERRLI